MARVRASDELKKISILYVEDEDFVRESFANMLQRDIKNVHIAKDGEEGWNLFQSHHIDIVVSDINMPKMNGIEMVKKIKENNSDVLIAFTTAFGDNEHLQKSIDLGVDGYFIKPIDINKVFMKLNSFAKSINSKDQIERYNQLLKVVLDEQREGIVLLDEDLDIKIYNNSFSEIYKKSGKEEFNSIDDIFEYCQGLDCNTKINKDWFKNLDSKKELILTCSQDEENKRYFQTTTKKVKGYIVFSITDITDLKQESSELKNEAMTDKLTGLYNRKVLDIALEKLLGKDIYIILLDIDNFKIINDTYGHLAGDKVLKSLAKLLKKTLRKYDLAIRWGGEEFIVLLKDIPNIEIGKTIAEFMRKKISELNIEKVGNFTCSFGVAHQFLKTKEDLDTLFQKADKLLYKAKKSGKNRVEA